MSPTKTMEQPQPQEKPFKTIEVIDTRTGKTCKVACMSCIRGHRTTACGIPVCRSKIFWTVKRPGRPSNSCTCRYGPGSRCECVVAKSACPHKPKKGEKRTVDCRCDEQGRFCCLLEAEHWDLLELLQKPRVELFPSREALEGRKESDTNGDLPPTPAYSVATPQTLNSVPSTPGPQQSTMQPMATPEQHYQQPNTQSHTPRFGMMGVGTPWGTNGHHGEDVLVWNGQTPIAPREPHQYSNYNNAPEQNHLASPISPMANPPYTFMAPELHNHLYTNDFAPVTQSLQEMSLPPDQQQLHHSHNHDQHSHQLQQPQHEHLSTDTPFDFSKLMSDYFNYQFPSAICQNCGLNGCSCRNCPAVMQTSSGSWAQGCARKHVQFGPGPTGPTPQVVQAPEAGGCCSRNVVEVPDQGGSMDPGGMDTFNEQQSYQLQNTHMDPTLSQEFSMNELKMADALEMDLSEFLVNEAEQSQQGSGGGCCCSGPAR